VTDFCGDGRAATCGPDEGQVLKAMGLDPEDVRFEDCRLYY
jgi:hypothetical protein